MLDTLKREAADDVLGLYGAELDAARRASRRARAEALGALERTVDVLWAAYLDRLRERSEARIGARVVERLDATLRTDEPEHMDLPDFPDALRSRMVEKLHRFNLTMGTYRRALTFARPALDEALRRTGRRPRLLDLASGHGGFPIELARHATRVGLPVEVTGSDVQDAHVSTGASLAREGGLPVGFRVVNGFHMAELAEGEYDVVTMLQAMHHFTPGKLARMIAESTRVGTTAFIGIDGVRAFWLAAGLPFHTILLTGSTVMFHDALVSARRMYDREELLLIARAAAPGAEVRCRTRLPGFNVLEVFRAPEA